MSKLNQRLYRICLSVILFYTGTAGAGGLTGAGATFPYPLYAKWAEAYKAHTGTDMNYQSIGSGGGIKQILANTVDFGATDAPLNAAELGIAGLLQFPAVMGGVVPVFNIAGVTPGQLKLDGATLADIYLGKITKWNDSRIAADNAGIALPDAPINVIHRADGSGTTFIFTTYLSQVSAEWKKTVGAEKALVWPIGTGGNGNEGVASYVQRIKNSIGYVEYAYILQSKMAYVQMKNRDGQFIKPDDTKFKAAAANIHWDASKGFYETLTNEPGKDSWPITGASFILIHKTQDKTESAKEVLKFFDWAFTNGDKLASDLGYVPLPETLKPQVRDMWKTQVKDVSGNALWQ